MKIKKGDNVKILTGKDRGKTGKVLKAMPKSDQAIVEGINTVKRHERPRKQNSKGQIVDKPMPIHVSNLSKMP